MTPQLGWKTQIHRTALIAPGSTQGRSTIERSAPTPKNRGCRKMRGRRAEHHDERRGEER